MFVLQVLAIIVIGGAARTASVEAAARSLAVEAQVTVERISGFMAPGERIVEDTVRLLDEGIISADDRELELYLLTRLANLEHISSVHVGYPDGAFLSVTAHPTEGGAFGSTRMAASGPDRIVTKTSYDSYLQPTSTTRSTDSGYDPTQRPWYRLVAGSPTARDLIWTDPYTFFFSGEPGVTGSRAHVVDGEIAAVVGVDVRLSGLDRILDDLDVIEGHNTMIVAGDHVIGNPDMEDRTLPTSGPRAPDAPELPTAAEAGMTPPDVPTGTVGRVDTASGRDLAVVVDMERPLGKGWELHLHQDEAAATDVATNQQSTMLKVMIGGTVVMLGALFVLTRVTRPIDVLAGQAATDALTGLANRRGIDADGAEMVAELANRTGLLSVLVLDLDGFKALNDRHGHHVGDDALRLLGRELRSLTRREDLVGRLGGDEFVVASRVDDLASAIEISRRVVDRLGERLRVELPQCPLGVSGGLAVGDSATAAFGDLLVEADESLIAAKVECKGMMRVADRTVSEIL